MTSFAYTAVDSKGRPVSGSIEAATWPEAEALLQDRGLTYVRPVQPDRLQVDLPPLKTPEAVELAAYLAELAATGLPLEGGLRALASDTGSPRMSRALTALAARLEAGESLESSLDALGDRLPEYVRAVIVAGSRSGQLAGALDGLLAQERELNEMSGRFRQAATYPAVLIGFLVAWLFFVGWWIVPAMPVDVLLDSFNTHGPLQNSEVLLVRTMRFIPTVILTIVAVALAIAAIARTFGGAAQVSRLAAHVPLIGSAWRQRAVVEFTGLLAVFLRRQLPLDESLRLVALAAGDPAVAATCHQAAHDVSGGGQLARSLDRSWLPPTLARLVEWGEKHAALADALDTARAMFAGRFERQTVLTRLVLPPVVFLIIAGSVLWVLNGIFATLIGAVYALSDGRALPLDTRFGIEISAVAGVLAAGLAMLALVQILRVWAAEAVASRTALLYAAVFLIGIGLLGGCLVFSGLWGLVAWLVIVVVWVRTAMHTRAAARRNLFSALTLAAREGMPMAPIGLAFAAEHEGRIAYRARDLGRVLDLGASLSDAAWMVPGALPPEAALAGRVGAETGDLAGALEATSGPRLFDRGLLRPLMVRLIYVVPALMLFVTFMAIKIAPSMLKIFDDFDMPLPPLTVAVLRGTTFLGPFDGLGLVSFTVFSLWFLGPLLIVLSLVIGVLAWLEWRGTLRPRLPGWKRIVNWLDMAMVLRLLALAAAHNRPLSAVLGNIADFHPKTSVRNRMRVVEGEIVDGAVWEQSMRRQRLLSPNDAALLSAAERVGNLPWALGQMADSFERRANYRLQVVTQVVMPLLILPAGIVVGIIVVAYFMPLTTLVRSLS
jgi:type II secretory pathway component PulF